MKWVKMSLIKTEIMDSSLWSMDTCSQNVFRYYNHLISTIYLPSENWKLKILLYYWVRIPTTYLRKFTEYKQKKLSLFLTKTVFNNNMYIRLFVNIIIRICNYNKICLGKKEFIHKINHLHQWYNVNYRPKQSSLIIRTRSTIIL